MKKPRITSALEFVDLSAEFLTQFRSLITAKAKDGDLSDDDVKAIFRAARGYAGGKGKAKKRQEAMTANDRSLTDMIRDIDTALYEQFPNGQGQSRYWEREVFIDHVIVCESGSRKMYRVPYARGLDGAITFGQFEEVEEEYVPVEMADLCAKGQDARLFIELVG